MVDAVLSFEGEGSHQFRILRAVKNRFGPTDEIGVFEMTGGGLAEIANPRTAFQRDLGSPGTAVFGTRARARCWWKSRLGGAKRARHAAPPWSAGTRVVRWCSRSWKPMRRAALQP
jgi:hypothetical protein